MNMKEFINPRHISEKSVHSHLVPAQNDVSDWISKDKIIKRGKISHGSTNFGSMRSSNKGSLKADKQKIPNA